MNHPIIIISTLIALISLIAAVALYRAIRWACEHELDPWLDGQLAPREHDRPREQPHTEIILCRDCDSPRFASAPCWHCSNQADAAAIRLGEGRSLILP